MIIAVDKEIPYGQQAFSQLGEVRLFAGRELKAGDLHDVDALIVRTVTSVNAALLDRTPVRFLGAASAGIDHVDEAYLRSRGIHFSYAAGCNANSVSEYIVTALHILASRKSWELKNKSIAVIGVGHVGSLVAAKAQALGMQVCLCDPPLRDLTGDPVYRGFDEVAGADILTFHVPLTFEGSCPTWHMLGEDTVRRLSPVQYVINSSRGGVFDGHALTAALKEQRIGGAVLDVWEEEPAVDRLLLELLDIGTPHIAGGALDGKIRATEMILQDLSEFFEVPVPKLPDSIYPEPRLIAPEPGTSGQEAVRSVLVQAYPILDKDAKLRALAPVTAKEAAAGFERIRTEKPLRLEFRHFTVSLGSENRDLAAVFESLGFRTSTHR